MSTGSEVILIVLLMSIKQILKPMSNSRTNSPNTPTVKVGYSGSKNSCFKHNVKVISDHNGRLHS